MMRLKRSRQGLLAMLMCATLVAAFAPAVAQAAPPPGVGKPVHVCPGPRPKDSALCHSFFLGKDDRTPVTATSPNGYSPAELRKAYNVSPNSSTAVIAIVDAYGYPNAESDLATYRAQFGLPECSTANGCFAKVNQDGRQNKYPHPNVRWAQESALDLDMASAICPSCKLLLVEANTNRYQDLTAAVAQAAKLGAHVISNSYGGGESGTTSYEPAYNQPGVAVTASSGDSGYGVQFPASSPHVTAVGGTSLTHSSTSRGWSETVWSGAGSGCSAVYDKPTWQTDTGCSGRTVADVSAVADPQTGVAVYGPVNGGRSGWMTFGGTSVGAPLIAGIYAANGGQVSYGSDPYSNTTSLFDITAGNNGTCDPTYLCTGGTAYDGPSGLGTPDGITAFGK